VLVMTTNRPEKLDDALIRPGRVDHQVAFENAKTHQIQELFERMYANELPRTRLQPSVDLTPPLTATTSEKVKVLNAVVAEVQGDELRALAREFAARVPEGMFSPAELQGFLLKRKKDPRKACEEVEKWVAGMLEVKRAGGKLVPQ